MSPAFDPSIRNLLTNVAGHRPKTRRMTWKKNVKLRKLVCVLLRSKSNQARSRSKRKRLVRRRRKRKPRRRKRNSLRSGQSLRLREKESDNSSFNLSSSVMNLRMTTKDQNKSHRKKALQPQVKSLQARSLHHHHQLRLHHPNHRVVAVMSRLLFPAHQQKNHGILISESFRNSQKLPGQQSHHPLFHMLSLSRRQQQRHLHRRPLLISIPPILSIELPNKRLPNL